jgi:protein-S-isoprenylcysteine O-methyltransferase Ste14
MQLARGCAVQCGDWQQGTDSGMEIIAYYLALVSLMAVPAALAAWFVLHPLAPSWRRVGPVATYAAVGAVIVAVMWLVFLARQPLLKLHFGVRAPLVAVAVVLFAASSYLRVQIHRQIPTAVVLGLPEISARNAGRLVTSGIYSRMRHPRYVAMSFAVAAVALFTNYLAVYAVALAYVPLIYLVALLEERELSARFGAAYRAYCARVPRFIPRHSAPGLGGGGDAT